MRELAEAEGRTLRFGLRIHTLSRDTSEEAWQHAQWLLDGLDPETVAKAQAALNASESTGQQRMLALRQRTLVVHRRARARGGARTCGRASAWSAAVPVRRWSAATRRSPTGSRSTTALGIDEFILSGYPHVEEAYWFGEGVMPLLRQKGIYGDQVSAPKAVAALA